MVSWVVRFLIVGGAGGGTLETHYSHGVREVSNGKITTALGLMDFLRNTVPSDKEFQTAFESATVSKHYLARYYLRALEKQYSAVADLELVPNENEEILTLEHVLPQSLSPAWSYIDLEIARAYCKRLGNLALLLKPINEEGANDSFDVKRPHYQKSDLKLTAMLAEFRSWDTQQIEERQKALAELAVKAWPLM